MNEETDPPDDEVQHPHDCFNRAWFGEPEAASGVFTVIAPPSLKELVRPENLRLEPVSFVDPQLRATQSDLLWACLNEGEILAFFYILWEHQSKVDSWMALRLFCYMSRIWDRWLQNLHSEDSQPKSRKRGERPDLPPIFPIVLYQGQPKWNGPVSLAELAGQLPEDLRPYFPDFRFHLETLTSRPTTDFPLGLAQLGISVLTLSWEGDFESWLELAGKQLRELHESGQRDKLQMLVVYALTQLKGERRNEFLKEMTTKIPAMKTSGDSIYDSLINEGIEQGEQAAKRAMIQNMRDNGLTDAEIIRFAGISEEELRALLAK